jgi:hypothetical protein
MIANDQQLQTTFDRIAWFQGQAHHLHKTETNPVNFRAAVSGFLAEIDRMQRERFTIGLRTRRGRCQRTPPGPPFVRGGEFG